MEPLARPTPPRSLGERARSWIVWFGVGRLVAASVATVVVVAGGVWLVRTPPPATEASLPRATAATVTATSDAAAPNAASSSAERVVLVHVAGAVVEPGVYQLVGDARVRDALVAAGGPTETADWDALNLAAGVTDGTKIHVPNVGEELPPPWSSPPGDPGPGPLGPVDVNVAGAAELESLPGIGPATAAAIITERERNGPFVGVDDLDRVPGIGPAKLEALRDLVTT
jgi:competence protein ComEA